MTMAILSVTVQKQQYSLHMFHYFDWIKQKPFFPIVSHPFLRLLLQFIPLLKIQLWPILSFLYHNFPGKSLYLMGWLEQPSFLSNIHLATPLVWKHQLTSEVFHNEQYSAPSSLTDRFTSLYQFLWIVIFLLTLCYVIKIL